MGRPQKSHCRQEHTPSRGRMQSVPRSLMWPSTSQEPSAQGSWGPRTPKLGGCGSRPLGRSALRWPAQHPTETWEVRPGLGHRPAGSWPPVPRPPNRDSVINDWGRGKPKPGHGPAGDSQPPLRQQPRPGDQRAHTTHLPASPDWLTP